MFESSDARMLLAAFDRGWSVEKFVKETGKSELDILTILDDLEQAKLVRGPNDFDLKPGLLLIREPEMTELDPDLGADTADFVEIIRSHWDEVEGLVASLDASRGVARGRMLYVALVGGVLTEGMTAALMDDKTLVPGPPERARRGEGYYAWLVEGAGSTPMITKQSDRVGRYTVYSVGTETSGDLRIPIEELQRDGSPVLESADAERWRVFVNVFSRDYLLPALKARRADLLRLHGELRAGRYTSFAEFAAWYYQELVSRVVESLVGGDDITAPEPAFRFAIRTNR